MFNIIVKDNNRFLVFGPKNNYVEVPISSSKEVLDRHYKGNLNAFFLFQNDIKKEIKTSKSSSNQFIDFSNNINIIWDSTPESVKEKYKSLSGELEKLNKSSELKIKPYLKNSSRKRKPKENKPRRRKEKTGKFTSSKSTDKIVQDNDILDNNPVPSPSPSQFGTNDTHSLSNKSYFPISQSETNIPIEDASSFQLKTNNIPTIVDTSFTSNIPMSDTNFSPSLPEDGICFSSSQSYSEINTLTLTSSLLNEDYPSFSFSQFEDDTNDTHASSLDESYSPLQLETNDTHPSSLDENYSGILSSSLDIFTPQFITPPSFFRSPTSQLGTNNIPMEDTNLTPSSSEENDCYTYCDYIYDD